MARSISITQPPHVAKPGPLPTLSATVRSTTGTLESTAGGPATVAIASGPSGATLGGTLTRTVSGGAVDFPGLTVDKAGTYTLMVSADEAALGLTPQTPWLFEYGKSGVAVPSVGGVSPVAVSGADIFASGGPAGSSYIQAPTGQLLNITADGTWPVMWAGPLTVHTLAKFPSGTWTVAFGINNSDASDVISMAPQFNGSISYGANGTIATAPSGSVPAAVWACVSLVRDATSTRVYVNGVSKAVVATGISVYPTVGACTLFRGSVNNTQLAKTMIVPSAQTGPEVLAQAVAWGVA